MKTSNLFFTTLLCCSFGILSYGQNTNYGTGAGSGGSYNSAFGWYALHNAIGAYNTASGTNSLLSNTTGSYNTASGAHSLQYNTTGFYNTASGYGSLFTNTTGSFNTAFGYHTLQLNTIGTENTALGMNSLNQNTTGIRNTASGYKSLYLNAIGSRNTASGYESLLYNIEGSGNTAIGYQAGYNETGSDKLYIDNSNTSTPLIYGDFSTNKIGINTNQLPTSVGGANTSLYSLYVKGGILTEEVRVRTGWADYVFKSDYELKSLTEVEVYIKENGHLPNVPSAGQVENEGIELGEITRVQQEKIEELTLYLIALQKQVDALQKQLNDK